jgi:hypothetical protein
MKKIYILMIALVLGIALFVFLQRKGTWSNSDYQECVNAGGSTQESDPPTCFHPNGDRITPGRPKK